MSTPILFEPGNIVAVAWGEKGLAGVVLKVDHKNAANVGVMNYQVAVIKDGAVAHKLWYANHELTPLEWNGYGRWVVVHRWTSH